MPPERKRITDNFYADDFDMQDELNLCVEEGGHDSQDVDLWLSRKEAKELADFIYSRLKVAPIEKIIKPHLQENQCP